MTHKHLLILAISAAAGTFAAGAIDASYYAENSVLSSGRWVKISVAESGMQQITPAQLAEWGFTNPSAVTVYGYGGVYSYTDRLDAEAPDDLCQQPTMTTTDGRILFYGEANARPNFVYWALRPDSPVPGVDRNPAVGVGYYYLTDSQTPLEPDTINFAPAEGATASNNHLSVGFYEDEVAVPSQAGHNYFGRDFVWNGGISTTFPLYDRFTTGSAYGNSVVLRIVAGARSATNAALKATFTSGTETTTRVLTLDKSASETVYYTTTYDNATAGYMSATVNTSMSRFYFALEIDPSAYQLSWGALDYLAYFYPRVNRLGTKSELLMCSHTENAGALKSVVNTSKYCQAWEVSQPHRVRPYKTTYNQDTYTLSFSIPQDAKVGPDTYASRSIVFNPSYTHHAVKYVGEVKNQNLHSLSTPDFLIVTNSICHSQAERLADIHRRYLGQEVLVVDIDDIYNEFSSGAACPWAVRRLAKMLYDRNPEKLRHILMFGGSSYDPRGIENAATADYMAETTLLPAYAVRDYQLAGTKTGSYSADSYFGMLQDSSNGIDMHMRKMDVNVGRLNAMNLPEAIAAVDKVLSYLTEPPTTDVTNHVIVCADAGDKNSHMENAEEVDSIFRSEAPGITVSKGYVSLYDMDPTDRLALDLQDAITRNFKLGVGYYTYSGHGAQSVFGNYQVWKNTLVRSTEYDFYPVAMLATCDSYSFDRLEDCIATAMVFQPKGGMIGVIGAGRSVYQARNQQLGNAVSKLYAQANTNTFLGDLMRESRNTLIDQLPNETGLHVNTTCYNLCGDPAIPLYTADTRIVTESINGTSVTAAGNGTAAIIPLGNNTVSGYVATANGSTQVDADFNGKIIMTLYEAPIDRNTYARSYVSTGESSVPITMDEDILAQYTTNVKDGRFSFAFVAPEITREGDYNRMTFVAYRDEENSLFPIMARGASFAGHMSADDTPSTPADTTPPVISAMYIDDPSFANGDVVGADFTLYAIIEPDAGGIHAVNNRIGSDSYLILDSRTKTSVSRGMYINTDEVTGVSTLAFPVKWLPDGSHDYELIVRDTSGNAASRSISFTVCNSSATASLAVEERPARTSATFTLEYSNMPGFAPTGRLIVEDARGNTVYSKDDVQFPYTWNLRDNSGRRLPDGIYNAYATVKGGTRHASTQPVTLVVMK